MQRVAVQHTSDSFETIIGRVQTLHLSCTIQVLALVHHNLWRCYITFMESRKYHRRSTLNTVTTMSSLIVGTPYHRMCTSYLPISTSFYGKLLIFAEIASRDSELSLRLYQILETNTIILLHCFLVNVNFSSTSWYWAFMTIFKSNMFQQKFRRNIATLSRNIIWASHTSFTTKQRLINEWKLDQ